MRPLLHAFPRENLLRDGGIVAHRGDDQVFAFEVEGPRLRCSHVIRSPGHGREMGENRALCIQGISPAISQESVEGGDLVVARGLLWVLPSGTVGVHHFRAHVSVWLIHQEALGMGVKLRIGYNASVLQCEFI